MLVDDVLATFFPAAVIAPSIAVWRELYSLRNCTHDFTVPVVPSGFVTVTSPAPNKIVVGSLNLHRCGRNTSEYCSLIRH